MEDFVIIYYLENIYQKQVPFLFYKNNILGYFVKRDFKFIKNNYVLNIKKYIIVIFNIISFNVK